MLLHLTDLSPEPLHAQISSQIRAKILNDTMKKGEILPSIRVLAKEIKVSVKTVQKAYDNLISEGLIKSKKKRGFFVCSLAKDFRHFLAMKRVIDKIFPIIHDASALGLSRVEIEKIVAKILKDVK